MDADVVYPHIDSTDLNAFRLLATFGEAVPLIVPDVYEVYINGGVWRRIGS
jgi:hypothetical protein